MMHADASKTRHAAHGLALGFSIGQMALRCKESSRGYGHIICKYWQKGPKITINCKRPLNFSLRRDQTYGVIPKGFSAMIISHMRKILPFCATSA